MKFSEEYKQRYRPFHVMVKPIGPVCNLDCQYCYYLQKAKLYPDECHWRMTDETLEVFVRDYIAAQPPGEVVFGWQGGEPTLMGLDFYRRAVEFQQKYCPSNKQVLNSFQTNGTLINDEWAIFFRENNFLIGISIDGPPRIHDKYRVDKKGKGSCDRVVAGLQLLKKHKVQYNVLCTVHQGNQDHAADVYHFFQQIGAEYVQFIPIVEHLGEGKVSERSVSSKKYGEFLLTVFQHWIRHDVGKIFVQHFDIALGLWLGMPSGLCVFSETCGRGLAMEHNGDLYACDHFVEPAYRIGNILNNPMEEMANSTYMDEFGDDKHKGQPKQCQECKWRFACQGACPKDRILEDMHGEQGLNYLCEGYQTYFEGIDTAMKAMGQLVDQGLPADMIMEQARSGAFSQVGAKPQIVETKAKSGGSKGKSRQKRKRKARR